MIEWQVRLIQEDWLRKGRLYWWFYHDKNGGLVRLFNLEVRTLSLYSRYSILFWNLARSEVCDAKGSNKGAVCLVRSAFLKCCTLRKTKPVSRFINPDNTLPRYLKRSSILSPPEAQLAIVFVLSFSFEMFHRAPNLSSKKQTVRCWFQRGTVLFSRQDSSNAMRESAPTNPLTEFLTLDATLKPWTLVGWSPAG